MCVNISNNVCKDGLINDYIERSTQIKDNDSLISEMIQMSEGYKNVS